MGNIQDKIDQLDSLNIDESSLLFEFRYRIKKYTNAFIQNQITINDFDYLLNDFEDLNSKLSDDEKSLANDIDIIRTSIRDELSLI
jgi:hypothetical protein